MTTVENAIVVGLDAERFGHPVVGATLTTVDPHTDPEAFRRAVEHTVRALRRRFEALEYLGFVEWTTGRGRRSGGHRRIHMHLLLRGLLPSEAVEGERVLRRVWSERMGADRVEVRPLRTAAGATAYLVHHHRKREQAPPEGWSGKRLRPSRGYFGQPVAELRAEARKMAQDRRLLKAARSLLDWEYIENDPDTLYAEEWTAALAAATETASRVTLVRLDRFGGIVGPVARAG